MIGPVYAKWLWDSRRSLAGWTVAILAVGCGYAAFWPTMDNPDMAELLESYPSELLEALNYTDLTTAAGYLNATVYGLVVAVLSIVFAIGAGTRTIAGEEEAGTLDLTLTHPVSRPSLALQRLAALATAVVAIDLAFLLAMFAISGPAELSGISPLKFAAMHLHLAAFTVMFGSLAFAVGAVTGRRAAALGVSATGAVLAYAAAGILPQLDGLAWVRDWSAFTWLNGSAPLLHGVDPAHLGTMLGLTAIFAAVGVAGFRVRDLAV